MLRRRHSFSHLSCHFISDFFGHSKNSCNFASKITAIMATLVLNVPNESLLSQLKKACMMLKGVDSVKVMKTTPSSKKLDITKTAGFKEAMEDVKEGRVTQYESTDDLFNKLGITL
jgi:hypothetical protein